MTAPDGHPAAPPPPAAGAGPPVWIVAVGDELLEGRTADTNSRDIQQALGVHAVAVRGIFVVHDEERDIVRALEATEPGALVILCGGLGSTPDDLTRDAVAAWAGVPLEELPAVRTALERRCRERKVPFTERIGRQAQAPAGLEPLPNPVGSAPGLVGSLAGRTLALLPGVPSELRALLPALVRRLAALGRLPAARPNLILRTAQLAELALVRLCRPVLVAHPALAWSWWLGRFGVDLRIVAPAAGGPPLEEVAAALRAVLGPVVYSEDGRELDAVVAERLRSRGESVAVAESCTAGLLGAALTHQPGASDVFRGGVIAYADDVKRELLGVDRALLERHGAVSREVATAMAAGARERLGATRAVAITGIAGPDGGSPDKPVGTTWIGLAGPEGARAACHRFPGVRPRNRQLATAVALDTLRRRLELGPEHDLALPVDSWRIPT